MRDSAAFSNSKPPTNRAPARMAWLPHGLVRMPIDTGPVATLLGGRRPGTLQNCPAATRARVERVAARKANPPHSNSVSRRTSPLACRVIASRPKVRHVDSLRELFPPSSRSLFQDDCFHRRAGRKPAAGSAKSLHQTGLCAYNLRQLTRPEEG